MLVLVNTKRCQAGEIASSFRGPQSNDLGEYLPVNPLLRPGSSAEVPGNPSLDEVLRLNESLNTVQKGLFAINLC
jgi:hypothetical protein